MPELSRFGGIIVKMLFNDTAQHNKPHVHVYYEMVVGWLALHEEEAYAAWNKAVRGESFDRIKPLV